MKKFARLAKNVSHLFFLLSFKNSVDQQTTQFYLQFVQKFDPTLWFNLRHFLLHPVLSTLQKIIDRKGSANASLPVVTKTEHHNASSSRKN